MRLSLEALAPAPAAVDGVVVSTLSGNVRLYVDENRDVTPASTERISDGTYSQDDGEIRFEFMDSIQLLNGETHFLITYQL